MLYNLGCDTSSQGFSSLAIDKDNSLCGLLIFLEQIYLCLLLLK